MKFITTIYLSMLVWVGTIVATRGDSTPRTDINPALLYYQAFLLAPKLNDADYDYLYTNVWQGQTLPERFGSLIAGYGTELGMLQRAAEQKLPCDWGVDLSRGPSTLLPHLSACKRAAQASRLHAMWELQQGNETAARKDLLNAFAVGRNSAPEGFLIGVLVQFADEAIVYSAVAENFSRFSPAGLQQLEAGFAAAPARTLTSDGVEQERIIHTGWLREKFQSIQRAHPDSDAAVLAAIRDDEALQGFEYFGVEGQRDTNIWTRICAAGGGTSAGIIKLVQDLDPIYARYHKLLLLPQPEFEVQAQKFDLEMQTSPNPLVKILLPTALPPRRKEFTSEVEQAMVQAAVEYKLHGEAGLQNVPDPCGKGPFALQRFVFQGEDRGFQLTSTYVATKKPVTMIFEEKDGPAFYVLGPRAGEAVAP